MRSIATATGLRRRLLPRAAWHSYLPFLVLSMGTLLSLVWASVVVWRLPYDGGFWTSREGQVINVDPNGTAYTAGIRPGDRLIAIDSVPLERMRGLYQGKGPGDRVIYSLDRDDRRMDVALVLTTPPIRERVMEFEQLFVALAFWAVSLVVWMLRPFDQVTRRFYLISQLAAATLALNFMAVARWPSVLVLTDVLILLLAPMVLAFYGTFPQPLSTRILRRLTRPAYVIALILIVWTLVDAARNGSFSTNEVLYGLRRLFITATLMAAIVLLVRRPRAASPQSQRRRRLLIVGMAGSLLPLIALSLVPELLLGNPIVDYPWTIPAFLLLPISFAYALRSGDLGRIDLLLNRSLVHLTTTAVLLGVLALAWTGLDRLLSGQSSKILLLILAAAMALLYAPARDRVGRWMDRLFYGGWYSYRSVVRTASAELSRAQNLEDLVVRLLAIARTMRLRAAVLLWPVGDLLTPRGGYGYEDKMMNPCRLPASGALAGHLTRNAGSLLAEELRSELESSGTWNALDDAERALVTEAQLQVWIPLVSHAALRGVLLLGERQGEYLLDAEDLDILHTLSGQAAVAAENVALLEAMREQIDELGEAQRLLLQTSQVERSHLARELHDRPLQDLYAIRYKLVGLQRALRVEDGDSRFRELQENLQATISELRAICSELRSPNLQHGLDVAIRSHAASFEEDHPEREIHLDLMRDRRLPEMHRAELFGVYQEAMQNVAKHAQASQVVVRLELSDSVVSLEIRDNGQGFRVPARLSGLVRDGHLGMIGMAERAEAIDGRLEVESSPGKGTTLQVIAPINCPAAELKADTLEETK